MEEKLKKNQNEIKFKKKEIKSKQTKFMNYLLNFYYGKNKSNTKNINYSKSH